MSPVGSPAETPPDALNCAAGDSTRGFIVGTRGSALALAQTQLVVDALTPHLSQPLDVQIITTHGDTTRAHLVDFSAARPHWCVRQRYPPRTAGGTDRPGRPQLQGPPR
ncbi:MAG: hypothetical protein U1U88_001303 [Lawsonella clevelandensis]